MELLLRLDGCAPPRPSRDAAVRLEPTDRIGDLVQALRPLTQVTAEFRLQRVATGEVLHDSETLQRVGLLSGELLRLVGPAACSAPQARTRGTRLSIVSGADGGRSQLLAPGVYLLGRAGTADIVLADPQISAHHAQLHLAEDGRAHLLVGQVTNPTLVNGHPVASGVHHALQPSDLILLGSTTIAVRPDQSGSVVGRDRLGHVPFHRTPHEPVQIPAPTFAPLGNVPGTLELRRFSLLMALSPILAGVAMALLLQNPRFLIFTLIAPVMAIANYRQSNSDQARRHARAVARWRDRVSARHAEVETALAAERRARLRAAPDIADLAERALRRRRDLWERGREFDDFLRVRVGTGDLPSAVTVKPDTSGDPEFLEELTVPLEGRDTIRSVPVSLPLAHTGVAALVGSQADTDEVATAMLLQALCLHSPEDLVVMAAVEGSRSLLDWLKWVPHTRSATSPVAGEHLTSTTEDGEALVRRILDVAEQRIAAGGRDVDPRWPWLLLVVDKTLELDTPLLTSLLHHCPAAGISVVWLTDEDARVRREAQAVVTCGPLGGAATVWSAGDDEVPSQVDLDRVKPDIALDVACALAPLRDASSVAAASGIPRLVPLFDALEVEEVTADWVGQQWLTPRGYSLPATVGMGADGPLVLDLVEHGHGPHGLIAGTSGSGKSELLMAIVAGLVAQSPPTRLNLLFVDYKGGAASDVFADLPHTVGRVTNLNAALARRALVSLRAELNRRMDIMRGKAKDLEQMLAEHPDEAPPSLVIILDEFATLVKEIPEFMEGIVDIAQRGRSLGIHLLLSTQRPQGAVNDNILANTNLRICLRMLDGSESSQIIGTPDAATIPVPLKGRAFARLGPGQLAAFQSAFTGAPLRDEAGPSQVEVVPFTAGARPRLGATTARERKDGGTQLDVLLEAVGQAADKLGVAEEGRRRRPWRDELALEIHLDTVRDLIAEERDELRPGRTLALGMLDDPANQRQHPAVIDLEEGGGLVVFGTGGSGKTTLLRAAATTAALDDEEAGGGTLSIFALDFSSGALTGLSALPQTAQVATWDDLEGVTRLLARLREEIERRRQALRADGHAGGWRGDRVLLLVDGYAAFTEIMEANKLYGWVEALSRIVLDGRQVGIGVILTADQRSAVKASLMAAFSNRLVLRQADEGEYLMAGLPKDLVRGLTLPPGRGFLNGERTLQVALPGDPPDLDVTRVVAPVQAPPLDDRVSLGEPAPAGPLRVSLGVADVSHRVVECDLERFDLLVTGPPGSGRSTALATIARQVDAAGTRVHVFGTPESPLRRLGVGEGRFATPAEIKDRLAQLVVELEAARAQTGAQDPVLVVIDDADLIEDALGHQGLPPELLATRGVRLVAASAGGMAMGASLLSSLGRRARSRLYLQPASADEAKAHFPQLGITLRPGLPMTVGRGVFVQNAVTAHVIQVADGLAPAAA